MNLPKIKRIMDEKRVEFSQLYSNKEMQEDYPLISKLATAILGIPYSTAHLERCFSLLKLIKTPLRNSLANESTEALMVCKSGLDLLNLEDRNVMDRLIGLFKVFMKGKN